MLLLFLRTHLAALQPDQYVNFKSWVALGCVAICQLLSLQDSKPSVSVVLRVNGALCSGNKCISFDISYDI